MPARLAWRDAPIAGAWRKSGRPCFALSPRPSSPPFSGAATEMPLLIELAGRVENLRPLYVKEVQSISAGSPQHRFEPRFTGASFAHPSLDNPFRLGFWNADAQEGIKMFPLAKPGHGFELRFTSSSFKQSYRPSALAGRQERVPAPRCSASRYSVPPAKHRQYNCGADSKAPLVPPETDHAASAIRGRVCQMLSVDRNFALVVIVRPCTL
jgi:hypothetical protein